MPKNEPTRLDELTFDVRTIERRLRDRKTDAKEYAAHLASLPDDEGNADYIEMNFEEPAAGAGAGNDLTFTSG